MGRRRSAPQGRRDERRADRGTAAPIAAATPRTFRLVVAYDGTDYAGWQSQPARPTVQALLARAVADLTAQQTRVIGASRTDAGVHALGQAVSFAALTRLAPAAIEGALNARLPRDVRVMDAREAPRGFDARRAALGKRYAYLIDTGRVASPLLRRYAWHVPQRLDLAAMRAALDPLRGRRDFSAFRAAAGRDRDPACTVRGIRIVRRRDRVAIVISADRFLHHMVRVIVGSAVDVGRGARDPSWIADVLASRDRRLAGPTAPAHGLVLLRVLYPEDVIGSAFGARGPTGV